MSFSSLPFPILNPYPLESAFQHPGIPNSSRIALIQHEGMYFHRNPAVPGTVISNDPRFPHGHHPHFSHLTFDSNKETLFQGAIGNKLEFAIFGKSGSNEPSIKAARPTTFETEENYATGPFFRLSRISFRQTAGFNEIARPAGVIYRRFVLEHDGTFIGRLFGIRQLDRVPPP